jgi:hypothetical protein
MQNSIILLAGQSPAAQKALREAENIESYFFDTSQCRSGN